MSILPGLGYPDEVFGVFSPIDRKGICQAGRGEVSSAQPMMDMVARHVLKDLSSHHLKR